MTTNQRLNPKTRESDFQIVYQEDDEGKIHWLYRNEAETMRKQGLNVGTRPSPTAGKLLRRCLIPNENDYPSDVRYIQSYSDYENHALTERWYYAIQDLTIPTLFCEDLNENTKKLIKDAGWTRAFVKNTIKSLVEEDPLDSVWPDVSFADMRRKFAENPRKGSFALRKYLPEETFKSEKRYWVVGDKLHHSSGNIPDIVCKAWERLKPWGGVFYTIDATENLIVEINGGESADRKTDNTADDFACWIFDAFH